MAFFVSACIIIFILTPVFLSTFSLTETDGFGTDLIHRDSKAKYFDLTNKAIQRSKNRANYFAFRSLHSTQLIPSDGDYLMKLSIGTPPFQINGIVDTASTLTWTQCAPCDNCFPQKLPLFTPEKSSTYKMVPGNSKLCKSLGERSSIRGDDICRYSLTYVDRSYSHGVLSSDIVTVHSTSGTPISQKDFVFGCGYENIGKFNKDASGVIGLGGGPGSFITQMNSLSGGKFSYCLVPNVHRNLSSKIYFGSKAVVSGSGVVSTSLHVFKNSYALRFKGISIGSKKLGMINLSNSSFSSKIFGFFGERIIVDSGTMLTHLPKKLYYALEAEMRREIKFERAADPKGVMRLCYKVLGGKMKGPIVTVHFVGANVRLYPVNTFVGVSENVHCLGFVPHDGVAILGNLAQRNFLVGYDLRMKRVSFKQTDCSKL